MTTSISNSENQIIVAFHFGPRCGLSNSHRKTFLGELNLQDLISEYGYKLFDKRKDSKGRFCKPYYADECGNEVVSEKYFKSLTGDIEFDYENNRYCAMHLSDCGDEELELIQEYEGYISDELSEYINKLS